MPKMPAQKKEKLFTPTNILLALVLMLFLISFAVVFTLNFRPLYYFDIDVLNIPVYSGFSPEVIRENYDALIGYNSIFHTGPLTFPTLPMSETGEIHFVEVKNIFVGVQVLMAVTLVLSLVGFILKLRKGQIQFMKLGAIFSIVLPLACGAVVAVNWQFFFVSFHKLFFNNDYWIFDEVTDPVITILPNAFFMHCAVMIMAIVVVCSVVMYVVYRVLKKKWTVPAPQK